jgi:T5orf172 domain-containing protein
MAIPFEPTRSYVYNAARYELLPRIKDIAREFGDEPFLLREISKRVLAETYTAEQLSIRIKKAESDVTQKMSTIFGFYIPFLAENLHFFENLGGGMWKNIPIDEELAEADAAATDVESNDAGVIYAYSFPSIRKNDGKFPIKIGLTATGDTEARVKQQCKATCCFEHPVVLKTWEVQRVAAVEDAIHAILEARGFKREAPGSEWFDTTLEEIDSILEFVQHSPNQTIQRTTSRSDE